MHTAQHRLRGEAEVRGLLFRYRQHGDRLACEQLVLMHLPLVRALARRFASTEEGLDDLVQVGVIGLLKAVERFDPERARPFTAYAVPTILGELRHHLRDRTWPVRVPRRVAAAPARAARRTVPLAEVVGAPDEHDDFGASEDRLIVEAALERLDERRRTIVRRYFLDGLSQVEIARELGISQIHVSRLLRGALGTMRDVLGARPAA
jgi:RNA polymerase sigma-B factor